MRASILVLALLGLVGCGADSALTAQPSARVEVPTEPRFDEEVKDALRSLNAKARRSVVQVREDGSRRRIVYATVVRKELLLTKLSALPDKVTVRDGDVTRKAEVVARDEDFDLALLHVEGLDRPAVEFADADELPIGRLVVCVSPEEEPAAFGVISAPVEHAKAFLGIRWDRRSLAITQVVPRSAADKAGLKTGDQILGVGEKKIQKEQDFAGLIGSYRPGDRVAMRLKRGDKEIEVEAELGFRPPEEMSRRERIFSRSTSRGRRGGFPRALCHDANLSRSECGAPMIAADGRIIGLSIARSERVKGLALCGKDLRKILRRFLDKDLPKTLTALER